MWGESSDEGIVGYGGMTSAETMVGDNSFSLFGRCLLRW